MRTLLRVLLATACVLSFAACGRTPIELTDCMIQVEQKDLDFGTVLPGESARRQVRLMNVGGTACVLSAPTFAPGSDGWYRTAREDFPTTVAPQQIVSFTLAFQPQTAELPLTRTGKFQIDIVGPNPGRITIPLAGWVRSDCRLAITPKAMNFGTVHVGETVVQTLGVENIGKGPCELRGVQLDKSGDPQFKFPEPVDSVIGIAVTQVATINVAFAPVDLNLPRQRTSALRFTTSDETQPIVTIPLYGTIDIGCELSASPLSVDFGKVTLNKTTTALVSLKNTGTSDCWLKDVGFTKDSHPDFELDPSRPLPQRIPSGGTDSVTLTFTAADISQPHLKTGTFVLLSNDERKAEIKIPLSATVDTFCKDESKWIYTVDTNSTLSKFDPSTKTYTTIATLACPGGASPNSMAVDQYAVAWVADQNGALFRVDTATGKCEPTAFVSNQEGIKLFGMGFVFDPATNTDTLYIAGNRSLDDITAKLATISFPDLRVKALATVNAGMPELSGTGDGALWGFFPGEYSSTGVTSLVRIEPSTGEILERYEYPGISSDYSWAMKFWGGSFWFFLDSSVYEVKRDDPKVATLVIGDSGHQVVGAGVSSCAPLRK